MTRGLVPTNTTERYIFRGLFEVFPLQVRGLLCLLQCLSPERRPIAVLDRRFARSR